MRDYVYMYEKNDGAVIMSGIEFFDLIEPLELDNLLLLKHGFDDTDLEYESMFESLSVDSIKAYSNQDIYNFGDFIFIDIKEFLSLREMSQGEIAEALYFGHKSAPLKRIELPSLKNEYLVSFHDNGYRLAIYFKNNIDKLFEHIKNEMNCDFDKSNLKTKSLLITKNKVREFDGDIGIETAIQIARHP